MRIALILPTEGPRWGSVRAPNLGNAMICEGMRRILQRVSTHYMQVEEFTYLRRPSLKELQSINSCDTAIFVGTNIFQPHVVGWEWQTEDLERIQVPYSLYGVGYSGPLQADPPEICEATKELVNWSRSAEAIGVRDPYTVRWLKGQGVPSELIGCPGLGYAETFADIACGGGRPVLAIRQILLHSPGDEAAAAQRVMIEWFFKEYPEGVCVVQEPADLQLLAGRPVITELDQIIQALSRARFVLTTRLHAGMIALSLGRPAVFLAHDTRVASFCEMVGLPLRTLSFEGLKQAIDSIRAIEQGDLTEFSSATELIPIFRERLERFLKDILSVQRVASNYEARARKLLAQIQADLYEVKQELAGLRRQLAAVQQEPTKVSKEEQLQVRDPQIASLQEQLRKRDQELATLRQQLEESQQRLTEIYNSFGWKLLERYWRWTNRLLPPGTRRHFWHSRVLRAAKIASTEGWRSLWHRLRARSRAKPLSPESPEEPALSPPVEWEQAAKKSDKIRLLVLVPTMGAGGMERCTEVLLKYFNRELFEVELAMIFDRELFYQVPSDVKTFVLERYRYPSLEARRDELPPDIVANYSNQLAWLETTAYKLGVLIQKRQPDVVLAQDFFAAVIALFAKRYMLKGVKIIGSLHNQYSTFLQIVEYGDLYAKIIQRYFNESDRIIAVSHGIATDLIENFGVHPEVIAVINNPMDIAQIENLAQEPITEHPWFSEDIPILLFVGRLTPQKGLTYLLQATVQARKVARFRVALIGEGEQRQELEALAQQLRIADDVLFLGKQRNPFKFMRRATCFVLPSIVEGLPYVIPEAMACGCPIIATDCAPGVRELLGDGKRGLLVAPRDPHALAEAILRMLWDDNLRRELSQAGLRYAQDFAAEKIVAQYEALLKAHVIS